MRPSSYSIKGIKCNFRAQIKGNSSRSFAPPEGIYWAIKESVKLGIPIVAILDTNSNPDGIDFPIPGNDDARSSIDLYCSLLKETILNAKKEASQSIASDKDKEALKVENSSPENSKEIKSETKLN